MRLTIFVTILMLLSSVVQAKDDVIIFLHNAWFEKNKAGETHPKFGVYDYEGIQRALSKGGRVIALEREADAEPKAEADKLVTEIKKLAASGISTDKIKVIGASKGAFIAQLASEALNEPQIRWVSVGGCHIKRMQQGIIPATTGVHLSVYEKSDTIAGACATYPALSKNTETFSEVTITTGKDHGFQFAASDDWITPVLDW